VKDWRRFFVPDKENATAFYGHKKMWWKKLPQRAKPDWQFLEPKTAEQAVLR
jgi:hypothetical protein